MLSLLVCPILFLERRNKGEVFFVCQLWLGNCYLSFHSQTVLTPSNNQQKIVIDINSSEIALFLERIVRPGRDLIHVTS